MSKLVKPAMSSPAEYGDTGRAHETGRDAPSVRLLGVRRALFAGATAFLSINLWTGAPLFALWVGSQASNQQVLSMGAVAIVVLVLVALTLTMLVALLWLEGRYRRLVGHPLRESRVTWLRSFNAQAEPVRSVPTSMVEQIVTVTVYVAVIALIVWFLFFAHSPLPHG